MSAMPIVDSAVTAQRWATERAIVTWAIFEADLEPDGWVELERAFEPVHDDGARLVCIPGTPDGPRAIFESVISSNTNDVRRFGVLCRSLEAMDAAHRSGVGAIVGIADAESADQRRSLLRGQ